MASNISVIRPQGSVLLGEETLGCPRCKYPNRIQINSDLPEKDYLTCRKCGYRAMINFTPILDKYGLPDGLSRAEKRQLGRHLKDVISKIK